jgi:hypothetical protein
LFSEVLNHALAVEELIAGAKATIARLRARFG